MAGAEHCGRQRAEPDKACQWQEYFLSSYKKLPFLAYGVWYNSAIHAQGPYLLKVIHCSLQATPLLAKLLHKVAVEAMGEDECVVPMDPEEAVRMISGLESAGVVSCELNLWLGIYRALVKLGSWLHKWLADLRTQMQLVLPQVTAVATVLLWLQAAALLLPQVVVLLLPQAVALLAGSKAPPAGNSGRGSVGAAPGAASGGGGAGTAPGVRGAGAAPGARGAGAAPGGRGAGAALGGGAGAVPGGAAAAGSGGEEPDDSDSNWVDEDALAGLASTHRSRNPLAPLIRARPKAKHVRGPNMKATEQELAETHGMHIKEVKRRMNFSSAFKQRRKTSTYNATVALVMEELNEDLPAGSKDRATVVCQMMKDDPSLGEIYTAGEIEDKRSELEWKKLLRSVSVRTSSKAAALNAKWVLENLTREITNLAERANMVGFAMFVRGDLHDQGIPTSIESRGTLNFFCDVFHKSPDDVMALLEMWAVTKNKEGEVATSLAELQKDCGAMILSGLRMITGQGEHCHELRNYIKVLVQGRGVGLLVWPKEVEFKRMGKQSSLGPLRTLYDHLKDGRTKWVKLSRRQEEKIVEEFEEMVREGKTQGEIHSRRSDLGGTHQVRNPRRRVHRRGEDSDSDQDKDNNVDIYEGNNSDNDDSNDPATSGKHTSPITTKKIRCTQANKIDIHQEAYCSEKILLHRLECQGRSKTRRWRPLQRATNKETTDWQGRLEARKTQVSAGGQGGGEAEEEEEAHRVEKSGEAD
ncbi:hypothetical protein B0H14DRAFT_2651654 [Mycena olivaceomarginata]|nr:hypothetical protein B0H14DRAFT_2651654 [Mycena olivaceomarginata]